MTETTRTDLKHELAGVLNRFSAENASDTPDWILAQFLIGCLTAWNAAVLEREHWYNRPVPALRLATNVAQGGLRVDPVATSVPPAE